jgi:hypothetical protein
MEPSHRNRLGRTATGLTHRSPYRRPRTQENRRTPRRKTLLPTTTTRPAHHHDRTNTAQRHPARKIEARPKVELDAGVGAPAVARRKGGVKKRLIIIGGAALVIVVAIAALMLFMQGGNSNFRRKTGLLLARSPGDQRDRQRHEFGGRRIVWRTAYSPVVTVQPRLRARARSHSRCVLPGGHRLPRGWQPNCAYGIRHSADRRGCRGFFVADAASAFVQTSLSKWNACAGKTVTVTVNGKAPNWLFAAAQGTPTEIMAWQSRVDGAGCCSHALRAVSEKVIDVSACGPNNVTSDATRIAEQIALKLGP